MGMFSPQLEGILVGGYWGCQLEGQIHSDSKDKKREDIKQAKYASGDNFVAYFVLRGLLLFLILLNISLLIVPTGRLVQINVMI